jgi:hypothetical protein
MRFIVLVLSFICASSFGRAGFLDFLLRKDLDVIVDTDMSPEGALMRTPSKENPVYYVAVSMGYRDLGGVVGGDKVPDKKAMYRIIGHALAKQGYLQATAAHPASQVIFIMWGSLYVQYIPNISNPELGDMQTNRRQMLSFMGGQKLGLLSPNPEYGDGDNLQGMFNKSDAAEAINEASRDDLYMAALASYDYQAFTQKKKKLLWTTRISCPSRGLVMADTLPNMITVATPLIGRETKSPAYIDASDRFKGEVQVGTPTVKEFMDPGRKTDSTKETRKPSEKTK